MKRFLTVAMMILFLVFFATMVLAGWQVAIEGSFTGTSTYIWNTNTPAAMLYFKAIYVRHDSAVVTNNVTLYRVQSDTNQFRIGSTTATASFLDALFTPDGNGVIAIPFGDGLKIVQIVTNRLYYIIDPSQPE